jgi:hypothetical protein
MKSLSRFFLLVPLALLAACANSDVRETLGINREAPDEFVVVSRPPLSLPPEFELRPPKPGEPQRIPSAEEEARRQLLGTPSQPASLDDAATTASETAVAPVLTADAPSGATSSFLSKVGADKADDSIRDKLGKDAIRPPSKEAQSLYEEIVGSEKSDPVVDAKKEAERLRANKDTGKPVTEGETPNADEKPKSVIDEIF